jgi:cytochrome P450
MIRSVGPGRSILFNILDDEVNDIYRLYAELRQAGAVVRDASGAGLVSRHRLVTEVLASPHFVFDGNRAFPGSQRHHRQQLDRLGFYGMIMFRTGHQHRAMRRLLAPLFSAAQLNYASARLVATAADLMPRLLMRGSFDLIAEVAETLPIHAFAALFDVEAADLASLFVKTRKAARLLAAEPLRPDDLTESLSQAVTFREEIELLFCDAATRRKIRHPLDDLLRPDGSVPFGRREILSNLVVILLTGYDTSALMMGNGLAVLLSRPDIRKMLLDDLGLASRVADELIRYDSPGQIIFRHAMQDSSIGGYSVTKGEMVALFVGSANRDPDEFERPDDLIFDRKTGRSLSFGAGAHACIGAALARIQLVGLLRAVVPDLANISLGETAPAARQRGLLRGYDILSVHAPGRTAAGSRV